MKTIHRSCAAVAAALPLAVAACTTQPGPQLGHAVPDLAARVGAPLPPDTPWDTPSSAWDGRATLTADALVAASLQNNRALRRALLEVDRRRAAYQDSQLPPNPSIEIGAGIPLSGGAAPVLAMLSAQLDWLWKREATTGMADAQLRAALLEAAAQTVATSAEARTAYVQAGGAWEILALSLGDVEVATQILNAEQQSYAAGAASAEAVNDARMAQAEASMRAMEAHRGVEVAKLRLLRAMGRGDTDTSWAFACTSTRSAAEECRVEPAPTPAAQDDLRALVRGRRLDIAAAEARVQGAEMRLKLAKASVWQGVGVQGGYERDMDGNSAFMLGAQVMLPIFNQGQFRIRMAEAELQMARLDADALWQQALLETRNAFNAAGVAGHHAEEMSQNVLAPFHANLELLAKGVDAGEVAPVALWRAQHRESHLRIQLAQAQRASMLADLGIERVLAGAAQPLGIGVMLGAGGSPAMDAAGAALTPLEAGFLETMQ